MNDNYQTCQQLDNQSVISSWGAVTAHYSSGQRTRDFFSNEKRSDITARKQKTSQDTTLPSSRACMHMRYAHDPIIKDHPNSQSDHPGLLLHCLRSTRLFSDLADEEVMPFEKAAQIRSYSKGKIVYLQGESARFFYVVVGGWIKLFRTMPEGQEVIIDMITAGRTFGEDAIFEQGCHTCSAQIVDDVQVLSIPTNLLKEQIRLNPDLAFNMFSAMSRYHLHHSGILAFNIMLRAPQRVGCFLLRLCMGDNEESVTFNLPYEKSLIADTLGMKGETFSRALAILRQKTGTRVKNTAVEIDSVKKLAEYVYGSDAGVYSVENI